MGGHKCGRNRCTAQAAHEVRLARKFAAIGRRCSSHCFSLRRTPSESLIGIGVNVVSEPAVRDTYQNFDGQLRLGKLFEDLDAFAGNVAFRHADDADPTTVPNRLVTASVDRIDLRRRITMDRDLHLSGNVSWVGNSSMCISLSLAGVRVDA